MLTPTSDEGSPRTGVAPVSAPIFWLVVVRRCSPPHRAGTRELVAALCDRSRKRGRTCVACRDSPPRGFRRVMIAPHDSATSYRCGRTTASKRGRHATRLMPGPRQHVVSADLPSRIQRRRGRRLNRSRKSRKRSSWPCRAPPTLGLKRVTEVEILTDGHGSSATGRRRAAGLRRRPARTHGPRVPLPPTLGHEDQPPRRHDGEEPGVLSKIGLKACDRACAVIDVGTHGAHGRCRLPGSHRATTRENSGW